MGGPGTHAANPLAQAARQWPNGEAVRSEGGAVTFRELAAQVRRCVQVLRKQGVGPGHCVGLLGQSSLAYLVNVLALLDLEAVACPLSDRWPPAMVEAAMQRVGGELLLQPPALPDADEPEQALHAVLPAGQGATIIFTSGSTGVPKAAMHSLGNHLANARGANANLPLAPGDRWLLSLPLYHVGGLAILFRCLLSGATMVIDTRQKALADQVAVHGVTHLSVVPTQLRRLLAERDGASKQGSLKGILVGGGPVERELLAEARSVGLPVLATYGCTEMGSQICTAVPGAEPDQPRLLPERELKLGADGEILVRGPTLFCGYLTERGLDPARDDDGWYHTGDMGRLIDGALQITGRRDLMFISGGENIHPEEIEGQLRQLDGVIEAVVVPVPDREFGERPYAFVRLAATQPLRADWLNEQLSANLPRFKLPVGYGELPDDQSLKVDRRRLLGLARELCS